MTETHQNIGKLTDHLFRQDSGKMVSLLTKIFGAEHIDLAEDVVQESFSAALQTWRIRGVPDNPSGWLFKTARNKVVDILRREKHSVRFDFNDPERKLLQSEYTLENTLNNFWKEEAIRDDTLRMMFACCHEKLSPEQQITLILKTLCGFRTDEIARAFLCPEDTVSKRLYRAKEFFRQNKILPAFPEPGLLRNSTEAVLRSIYLIFNEGYYSVSDDKIIRYELIGQAMYLCQLLCENELLAIPEVFAVMALMCFHAARTESRESSDGEIILLEDQDRSRWDLSLIDAGVSWLACAANREHFSSYHIEAAIAFEHCSAKKFKDTNWENILRLYDLLLSINPSPVPALNRIIVFYKVHGYEKTMAEINLSAYLPVWEKHYLFYSFLGEIYAEQDGEKSRGYYDKAIEMTSSEKEKKLLTRKKSRIR